MSDKLQPNPEVPSLFGGPVEGGRNFRAKKDVKGMANRVGKQWENIPQKEIVPLPESPTSKAKPKVMANLPGVHYKDTPTLFGAKPQADKPKPGKVNLPAGDGAQKPGLFAGSNNYFEKATGGKK